MIEEGATSYWERLNLDVCTDCLMMIANGESEGEPDIAERIDSKWPSAEGWSLYSGSNSCDDCNDDEYGCEGWFSWSSCEGCGSSFGGDRHHATAMRELDPLEVLAREGRRVLHATELPLNDTETPTSLTLT